MQWHAALLLYGTSLLALPRASAANIVPRHGDEDHAVASHGPSMQAHNMAPLPLCNSTLSPPACVLPVDVITAATDMDPKLRLSPNISRPSGHSHGLTKPLEEFNETRLFSRKGPMALSYIEWDFATGMGNVSELHRFTSPEAEKLMHNNTRRAVIGSVHNRWRTLADQHAPKTWLPLLYDIRSRIGNGKQEPGRHPGTFFAYGALVIFSGFVLLPLLLCLQVARSLLVPFVSATYLVMLTVTNFVGSTYFALTPALYPPNALGGITKTVYWLSIVCFGVDAMRLFSGIFRLLRLPSIARSERFGMVYRLLAGSNTHADGQMSLNDVDSEDTHTLSTRTLSSTSTEHTLAESIEDKAHSYSDLPENVESLRRVESPTCYATNEHMRVHAKLPLLRGMVQSSGLRLFLDYAYASVTRAIVLLTFVQLYVGIAIYTGSCRAGFKNPCLAHGIKGAVFFWYGILTFVRYLGAFGEFGWAWNLRPTVSNSKNPLAESWRKNMPSGEFLECFFIFLYGITNTWLERLSAKPGDPYTVKQVQHISIAVMFWFVGLAGMGLEINLVRSLLSYPIAKLHPSASPAAREADVVSAQRAPPSYAGSFNPFPALVIGVTGIAMAAHHQDYVYEVQIHVLWGLMLAVFSVMRIITYVTLWLRPPTSVLPSRPPSEALASFSLALGGVLFMLSNEEVSFAAMRSGFSDFMAILNIAVALIGLVFCWTFCVMVIKAWAVRREVTRMSHVDEMEQAPAFVLDDLPDEER